MVCVKCGVELPADAVYCHICGKKQTPGKRKALKRANGMGTVYKLPGRRKRPWVAAKNKTVIGCYETKTAALEALERLTGQNPGERYNMTFAEVFREWSAEHYPTITKPTVTAYNRGYAIFAPLHNRKFRELRTADFQSAIDKAACPSYSSRAKYKQLITQISTWAIREQIITTNFATYVRLPEKVKKEKGIFTDEEIAKIEADGSETAQIVLMLIGTGMRIGELFNLPVTDYHSTYCIGGEKTEAGRDRIIPIRPEVRPYFAHFAGTATGRLLLSGYEGNKQTDNFRRHNYKTLLSRLDIEYKSPHATRHTYASRARRAGMPPEVLQKILGHTDYSTTANIYVHTDIEELVQAVER